MKKPEPKPKVTAEERIRRLRESAKTVDQPKPAPKRPSASPVPAPRIDPNAVAGALSKISDTRAMPGPIGGGGGGGDVDNYKGQVVQVLWRLWHPTAQRANEGIPTVAITIQPNGTITGARLIQSSGDAALDRSVLAIFDSPVQVPPPPGGRSMALNVNFIRNF